MSNTFQKNFDPLSKRKISEIQIFCRASVFTRPGIRGSAVPDHHFYVWHTAGCRTPPLVPVFDPTALGVHRNVGRICVGGTGRFRVGGRCYRFC